MKSPFFICQNGFLWTMAKLIKYIKTFQMTCLVIMNSTKIRSGTEQRQLKLQFSYSMLVVEIQNFPTEKFIGNCDQFSELSQCGVCLY